MLPSNSKLIAFLAEGRIPQLADVDNVVNIALAFEMPVCVVCFTQAMLDHWLVTVEQCSPETTTLSLLDVLDSNRATLPDWKAYLQNKAHHLTILSGAHTEIRTGQISVSYM